MAQVVSLIWTLPEIFTPKVLEAIDVALLVYLSQDGMFLPSNRMMRIVVDFVIWVVYKMILENKAVDEALGKL